MRKLNRRNRVREPGLHLRRGRIDRIPREKESADEYSAPCPHPPQGKRHQGHAEDPLENGRSRGIAFRRERKYGTQEARRHGRTFPLTNSRTQQGHGKGSHRPEAELSQKKPARGRLRGSEGKGARKIENPKKTAQKARRLRLAQ